MSRIMFIPYGASKGCLALRRALKEEGLFVKRTKRRGSTYRGNPLHTIINWGTSSPWQLRQGSTVLNKFESVALASNKLELFKHLRDAGRQDLIPRFTEDIEEAKSWIEDEEAIVYCRTLTRASQGRGIVVAHTIDELVQAPLYTMSVPLEREMRVHVFNGSVIDVVQKKRMSSERREEENIALNEEVRNHSNGWIFVREGVYLSEEHKQVALDAISLASLDFGAVDLIVTPQDTAKVLEINTAPGLEGTTVIKYKEAIMSMV